MAGGGSERQLSCLANDLAERSEIESISLVTLAAADNDYYPLHSRIERIGLGLFSTSRGWWQGIYANYKRIAKLRNVAMAKSPELVISFCDRTNVLALVALSSAYRILISERSDPRYQRMPRAWEWLRKKYYPRAACCVAQSEEVANYLRIHYYSDKPNRVRSIPSAIDPPQLDIGSLQRNRLTKRPKILLYVGRISPEKGVDRLLDAWEAIESRHPAWRLRIVGEGPDKEKLVARAKTLGINSRVEWLPWTTQIWEHWADASAFAIASDYEGFPQALLEAMTAGLPGVVRDCSPVIREVLRNEENGLVVPRSDDLSIALDRLLAHPDLQLSLGERAARTAEPFQWRNVAPLWYDAMRFASRK